MKDYAKLAVRLLSIYFLVIGVNNIINAVIVITTYLTNPDRWSPASMIVQFIFSPIFFVVIGLILWFSADSISLHMVSIPEENGSVNLGFIQIQTLAFSIVGLILTVNAVPSLAANIYNIALSMPKSQDIQQMRNKALVIEASIKTVIGIWLIFGSAGIVNAIKTLGKAGIYTAQNEDEK